MLLIIHYLVPVKNCQLKNNYINNSLRVQLIGPKEINNKIKNYGTKNLTILLYITDFLVPVINWALVMAPVLVSGLRLWS